MRILLTFENFVHYAGTETYTLTVARELERLGHDAVIYSPNRGPMAELAKQQGIRVVGASDLPEKPELVIFCDTATCHELASRYRGAARIFVAHSAEFMLTAPSQLGDRCQVLVALNDRVRRAIEARRWHPPVVRLRQPIELLRLRTLARPRSPAKTVLVMTNNVVGPRAAMIEDACHANGLDVNWIGMTTTPSPTPEFALAAADIVIGLGRCVLEAMAAGRAAYVYGVAGGDGWVTPERYPAMEADGFAGFSARDLVLDGARLAADLGAWNEQMGEVNRDLAVAYHGAREHATELVELARTLDPTPLTEPTPGEELAHLVRLEMRNLERAWSSDFEVERLHAGLAERDHELATLRSRLVDAEAAKQAANEALDALRRTRRYQLACRVAAPLDRLRGR